MGICRPNRCGCGITSSTLIVTGSGNEGDPYEIDGVNPFVTTETTPPALPEPGVRFLGQVVSTSDTLRLLRWNGTTWDVLSEPPQPWTPVLTQGVGVTYTPLSDGVWYQRSNGRVDLYAHVTIASSGTSGQRIDIQIPFRMNVVFGTWSVHGALFGFGNNNFGGSILGVSNAPDITNIGITGDNYASYSGLNPVTQLLAGMGFAFSVTGKVIP